MSDFENLDYYELLGVPRSASVDEIKRAYRREISKYHPDRFINGTLEEREYARTRSQHLTEAYSVLSDFSARSAYNRGQTPNIVRNRAPRSAAPVPSQPRDHQAELYEQAQAHLAAGRLLQAIGALRQLQQINPFYRDSASLLADAEARLNSNNAPAGQPSQRIPRALLIVGGVAGGIVVVALAVWALSLRSTAANPNGNATASVALAATDLPTVIPEPTQVPDAPTPVTAEVAEVNEPSPVPSTVLPTAATSGAPIATAQPNTTPTPSASTASVSERGTVLFADSFANGGWAAMQNAGWEVGYSDGRYHIRANQGFGNIWSFRTSPAKDASIGVDVQVTSGEGGMMVRFLDANNYVSVTLNPSNTSYRIDLRQGGTSTTVTGGQSESILAASQVNRLVARVSGNHVQVLCNGQVLADVDVPSAPDSERYGLLVIANDSASEAFFDNLEVRSLDS